MRSLSDKVLDHLRELADAPDLSGTKYELIEKIGQGGMGSVYLARDRDLDRNVALKVLSLPTADESARARLLQEARIIARLEHPGIVPVHDVGTLPDGRVFYVMKLVRGKRLDEHQAMPLSEKLQTFEKICQAVAFAHAHGILHRDLKPQNIMVAAFGEVLVMDWGIAKLTRCPPSADHPPEGEAAPPPTAPLTGHGQRVGTPGYMAPEQAHDDGAKIDERADVYGLGGILYFLLTGLSSVDGRHARPRLVDSSVPRPLEAICLKTLAAEPTQRYGSVADLSADLARFLAGARVAAYPESIFDTTRRFLSNYRAAVILILAYLVMRILLLIFAGA